MKLEESKQKIPATFITSYVADAWEKVGNIKADLEAIKSNYTGTKVVCECLQDIIDAYLVTAGRLQAFLDNEDYVTLPELEDVESKSSATEPIKENVSAPTVNTPMSKIGVSDMDTRLTEDLDLDLAGSKISDSSFEYTCSFEDAQVTQEDYAQFSQIIKNR